MTRETMEQDRERACDVDAFTFVEAVHKAHIGIEYAKGHISRQEWKKAEEALEYALAMMQTARRRAR